MNLKSLPRFVNIWLHPRIRAFVYFGVLHMLFAGRYHLFRYFSIFSMFFHHKRKKEEKAQKLTDDFDQQMV